MVKERIELELVIEGEKKIKRLEDKVRGLSSEARGYRSTNNRLLLEALEKNKKLTEQDLKQVKLRRLKAEKKGIEKQRSTAILATTKRETAELKKQLAIQRKQDKLDDQDLKRAARKAQLARDEAKASRQRGQQGGLIGAGFPLLFGGGAGSVIGGGIGGVAGEKFLGKGGGFAGSIALSAVGAQIDALVGSVMELGKATTSTTGAMEFLTENELWLDENTKLLAESMKELGQVEEAAALAGQQLGIILGQDALDAMENVGKAGAELSTATTILWNQFLGLAAFMVGPLANAVAAVMGNAAQDSLFSIAEKQAGTDMGDRIALDKFKKENTVADPASGMEKFFREYVLGVAPAAEDRTKWTSSIDKLNAFIRTLNSTKKYSPVAITEQDRKNFEVKPKKKKAEKSNRDAENLVRAQQINQIERDRLALMQTMEPMIGRAAAARDRAYAIEKARFDTEVAISKLIAKDMPPLQKQVEIDTERVKLQQKLTVLKRKESERLMQEEKTLREIIQYSELDYEIATALTNEKVKQLQIQKKIAQVQNSDASDPQKQAQIDAVEKMGSITKLDQHVIKLNRDLNDTDAQIISLATSVETAFAGAMSNAITGLIDGTQTAQEAFANMFAQIGKAFIDMATQIIAKALIMKALGVLGGGTSGGGLTADQGLGSGFSMGSGLASKLADGGFITSPTQATVGEGGSNEYVIPSNKMSSSMDRWNSGMRGDSVINGAEPTETAGGMVGSDQPSAINIAGGVLQFNDTNYIKQDQIPTIVNQASKAGEAKALRRLQMSPATRQKLGI